MAETGSSELASPPQASPDSHETLPQSGRKRSHEDMTETHQERVPNSSATLVNPTQSMGEIPDASQVVPPSSAYITAPSQHAHSTMPPPPRPPSAVSVSSGNTEMSAQAPTSYQPQKEKSTPAVKTNIKSEHHSDPADVPGPSDDTDSPNSSPSTPPDEGMESFDWDALIAKYDARMEALDAKEYSVMEEFSSLCAVRHLPTGLFRLFCR